MLFVLKINEASKVVPLGGQKQKQKSSKSGLFGNFFPSKEDDKTIFEIFVFFSRARNHRRTKTKIKNCCFPDAWSYDRDSLPALSGVSDQRHKCTKTLIKLQISVSLQPYNYFRKLAYRGIWSKHDYNCSKRNISWINVEQQTNNWKNWQFLRHQKVEAIVLRVR